jgi:hypothetical protein
MNGARTIARRIAHGQRPAYSAQAKVRRTVWRRSQNPRMKSAGARRPRLLSSDIRTRHLSEKPRLRSRAKTTQLREFLYDAYQPGSTHLDLLLSHGGRE